MSTVSTPDQDALDRLVDRTPLVFVGLVTAEEVKARDPTLERLAEVAVHEQDAGREIARVGVDAGVVEEIAVVVLEVDARGDPSLADPQGAEADRAIIAVELEHPPNQDAALPAARRVGKEPVDAPALLVQVDEGVEVPSRRGLRYDTDWADTSRPSDFAADLVACLLAEPVEECLDVDADGQRDDRTDVLALDVDPPALG